MTEIECFIHPLIKEVLEQQRIILEMQKELIMRLAAPTMIYKEMKDKIEFDLKGIGR